jgi:hypothetical protein
MRAAVPILQIIEPSDLRSRVPFLGLVHNLVNNDEKRDRVFTSGSMVKPVPAFNSEAEIDGEQV